MPPKKNYLLLASRRDTIISDTLSEYSSAVDGPMNDNGLAAPVKIQDDILFMTRKAFGKSN